MLRIYLNALRKDGIPEFESKFLFSYSLERLKHKGYFCGMDYASKNIYTFSEYISRFSHSLTTSLLTYNLTEDKTKTIAALCHDIATPCFSHVIDYMNKDYTKQESTEEYTEKIIRSDEHLIKCMKQENINIDDVINFKQYSVVDNDRPKLCADRLDGIILTGIAWTKNIEPQEIKDIIAEMRLYTNEFGEQEIGFNSESIAQTVVEVNKSIDEQCHSSEDNYMMELLAKIVRTAIKKNIITYDNLFDYKEEQVFKILDSSNDLVIKELLKEFRTKRLEDIPKTIIPEVKSRNINPLVQGKRMIKHI